MEVITEKFFATGIGYSLNENNKNIKDKLVKRCLEIKNRTKAGGEGWVANKTYNTVHRYYNLHEDTTFHDFPHRLFGHGGDDMSSDYIQARVPP